MNRMFDFAQTEIQQLVEMSIGGEDDLSVQAFQPHAAKLARKILMNANDPALEPLRVTIQLSPQQYQEGIFCWKAFIYYKWRLQDVLPALGQVMGQIEAARPRGAVDNDTKAYLVSAKKNIRKAVTLSCRKVNETLAVYDDAYRGRMTGRGQSPPRFRLTSCCGRRTCSTNWASGWGPSITSSASGGSVSRKTAARS